MFKVSMYSDSFVASQPRESDVVKELFVFLSCLKQARTLRGRRNCTGVVCSDVSYVDDR
uniref:Uncharacterized protein n=1 Tax=Setaria italica TaxID=4555 RepID=K3ZBP6_SETIT